MVIKLVVVAFLFISATICLSLTLTNTIRTDGLQQRLKQLANTGGMILLDGDNIRGKTKFQLSKEDLCRNVEEWMSQSSLFGCVTLIYDHASSHSAYFLPSSGTIISYTHYHGYYLHLLSIISSIAAPAVLDQ